jgi:hypothetical protein
MAIILNSEAADSEPQWVELGGGAAVLCVAATSQIVHVAKAMADAVMIDLAAGGSAVTRVGGRIEGVPDLSSESEIEGAREVLTVVSIAELIVRDWRGVLDADRKPLRFRPSLLALLLSDQKVFEAFSRQCLRPVHEVVAEGNVSGLSPNGISARARAKPIVKAAKPRAPRAPRPGRGTARTTKTRH